MLWIFLVLLYGILKGVREVVKKKSLNKSTVMEVLIVYTVLAFLMVVPDYKNAMGVSPQYLGWIACKSFLIFLAWICSFKAIDKMPISVYGVLDLSRVLFATLLGTLVLGEVLSAAQKTGLVFVSVGLLMLRKKRKETNIAIDEATAIQSKDAVSRSSHRKAGRIKMSGIEKVDAKYIVIAIISCMLNALSGLMDKILMKTVNSSQLQFWYMLFLVLMYLIYIMITKTQIRWKLVFKNHWIWLLSLLFIIADKALFIANGMPDSKVTIMTLIKQSGCIVTILSGKFIFKEENIGYKLLCATIVVAGIVIAVM